jgi:hypothetical protein
MALIVVKSLSVDYWVSRKTVSCLDTITQPESGVNLACKNPDKCREFGCEKDCVTCPVAASRKVYMVSRCYTEPETVDFAVFSTRERAAEYISMTRATMDPESARWPEWDIVKWEVDEP